MIWRLRLLREKNYLEYYESILGTTADNEMWCLGHRRNGTKKDVMAQGLFKE